MPATLGHYARYLLFEIYIYIYRAQGARTKAPTKIAGLLSFGAFVIESGLKIRFFFRVAHRKMFNRNSFRSRLRRSHMYHI